MKLLITYLLAGLVWLSAAPLRAEMEIGRPPYLPLIMRSIIIGSRIGEFSSGSYEDVDDTLGYRAFRGGDKIDPTPELLTVDQRRGYMEMAVNAGDSTFSLKLWPILKDGVDGSGLSIEPDQWLTAFSSFSCGTGDCGQEIYFYRIYCNSDRVPYFAPVPYKDVLPVVGEEDFIKPAPSPTPCFNDEISYLSYSFHKDSQNIEVILLKTEQDYFMSEGCAERVKPVKIQLEWNGSKFKKGRALPFATE